MLRIMQTIFDKNKKILLVALAALLVAFFTIPQRSCRPERQERLLGTLYGKPLTVADYEGFVSRWRRLELPFVRINPRDPNENAPFNTLLILHAARRHGIQVGPDAVTKRLHGDPPMRVRIEYVLADPQELAKDIKPSDADLKAHYDANWKNKSEKFEDVKDRIRDTIAAERSKKMAEEQITLAQKVLASAPRDGEAWLHACRAAARQTGLTYTRVPDLTHALALRLQTGMVFEPARQKVSRALWPLGSPLLPEGFADAVFRSRPGEPSKIWVSGDKRFIFRVTATSAGIQANGKLFLHDEGWRNGRFMVLKTYPDYESVIKEKRQMDVAQARRGFEEYLAVQKFLALAFGGVAGPALTSLDAREQWAARQNLEVKALLAHVPVAPFIEQSEPDPERLLSFYDARKQRTPNALSTAFGYALPEQVQIEYLIADLGRFERQVELTANEIATYYVRNREREFLAGDGKTPKPLAEVRSEIVRKLTRMQARSKASAVLTQARKKCQPPTGEPLTLKDAANQAGLTSQTSRFFAQAEVRSALPALAGDLELAKDTFGRAMRPAQTADGDQTAGPLSAARYSGDIAFMFRVATYRRPRAPLFTRLSPRALAQVRRDYAHTTAVQKATAAAQQIKANVARALIAAIAAENKLAVATADVKPASVAADASSVPPVLADYVTQQLQSSLGGIARLIKDGDTYYTAVITETNKQTYEVKIDYVRFTEKEFTAAIQPSEDQINERTRSIRDAARKAATDAESADDDKPEPTKKQIEQAGAELIAEWKQRDFQTRYIAYLGQRLTTVFREYVEANPLEVDRTVVLRQVTTPSFFHADDTFPMSGDPALIEAAFKLKPNELSEMITGKSAAAIMLLAGEESRTERKVEFVSVDPADYDSLSITVSDADAETYYNAHPDDFRQPARAKAEFVFASFENVANVIAGSITLEEIEAYYAENASSAYQNQPLDQRLRDAIRRVLAQKRAETDAAEQAIGAAYKNAQASPLPLERTIIALDTLGLAAGTTPDLSATDYMIPTIGLAPKLAEQIVAAEQGKLVEPVRTSNGWVIFRVVEKQAAVMPPLAEVMPAAQGGVRRERLSARAATALEKVRAFLDGHPETTITEALARPELAAGLPFGPSVRTTGFFDKARALNYPFITTPLSEAIFAAKPGHMTAIIKADDTVQLARVIEAKTNRLVKVHYVRVGAELYAPKIKISTADAQAHYNAHKADENRPQRYELEYLVPNAQEIAADISPSDTDIADAYKQVKHLFPDRQSRGNYLALETVRWQIVNLLKARRGRQAAAELADKAQALISKDAKLPLKDIAADLTKLRLESVAAYEPGGDNIPWRLSRVAGLDAFVATAQPGETSPVLQAAVGPIIVRVTKVLPAGPAPFDEVEARIKKDLAMTRGLVEARKLAEQVRAKIVEPTAPGMQAAAAQFQVATARIAPMQIVDTGGVTRETLYGIAQRVSTQARTFSQRYQQGLLRSMEFARQMRDLRWGLSELAARDSLFRLRPGEIGEPVATGDRADICSLAVLAESRHAPSAMDIMLGARLGWEVRAARLRNLAEMIQADVMQASGAR